jgi:hypothetical protein
MPLVLDHSMSRMLPANWIVAWLFALSGTANGMQATEAEIAADGVIQIELGLGGTWKLGHLCPLRIRLPEELRRQATQIEVHSVDGDGVEVAYCQSMADIESTVDGALWMPIRIGRQFADISVRILGSDGSILVEQQVDANASRGLPSAQPLIVAVGSEMGINELIRKSSDGSTATFSTTTLTAADALPPSWRGYSSCDLIILSCRNADLLAALDERQWSAIDTWIRRGGGCVISLGGEAEALSNLEPLRGLLPGSMRGVGRINNPGLLETLVATDEPLRGFPCSLIDVQRGKTELTLADSLARDVPWWVSYAHGQGTIRFVASDLADEAFADWKDRKLLWQILIEPYLDRSMTEAVEESQVGDSSYLGYNDLVGQMRASLDVFPSVRVVSFGQVAAVLIGLLILICPVD